MSSTCQRLSYGKSAQVKGPHTIAIASGKGGVGKTLTTVNFAMGRSATRKNCPDFRR